MTMSRLPKQPGEVLDRSQSLAFTWNGEAATGYKGDTIASAIAAGGNQIISRSMKYHRARGLLTADYWDPNAFAQVGDEPNVRTAHRQLEAGMTVEPQNVWPSLDHDAKAANQLVARFLSPGFYYKTFIHPQKLWPEYQKVLRTFAPGGTVDYESTPGYYDKRYSHPDVVVAGGGPAGMAAAIAAAHAGARVMLVEHEHRLGGHLLWGSDADRTLAARTRRRSRGRRCRNTARLDRDRPVRRQLARHRATEPPGCDRALDQGSGQGARRGGGPHRAAVCVRGQRSTGCTPLRSGSPVDQHVCGQARHPSCGPHRESRGRRNGRDLERVGVDVARVVDARTGGNIVASKGSAKLSARSYSPMARRSSATCW